MTLETIISWVITAVSTIVAVYGHYINRRERNRIKAKEEVWKHNTASIVYIASKIRDRIDENLIQDVKEIRGEIEDIGAQANAIHSSINEELGIKE